MAAERARGGRERRPAVWPWLVMPLIVLLVYFALLKVHRRPEPALPDAATQPPAAAQNGTRQQ
jgi:hypothetical protein